MMSSTMRTWGSGITCSLPTTCWASLAAPAPTLSFAPVPLQKQVCCACCGHKLACYDSCVPPLCLLDSTDCSGVLKLALRVDCVPVFSHPYLDRVGCVARRVVSHPYLDRVGCVARRLVSHPYLDRVGCVACRLFSHPYLDRGLCSGYGDAA